MSFAPCTEDRYLYHAYSLQCFKAVLLRNSRNCTYKTRIPVQVVNFILLFFILFFSARTKQSVVRAALRAAIKFLLLFESLCPADEGKKIKY